MARRQNSPHRRVRRAFDRDGLKRVCEMYELDFPAAYPDLTRHIIEEREVDNFYYFADRGSDILFVAHLDTVVAHANRLCDFAETKAGPVGHSGAFDDRLGAYIGLELMPKLLGFGWADILLTVGEESGRSTAEFFTSEKAYNWVIEFDRKGTDVVMYKYHDFETAKLVRDSGAVTGNGTVSDISYMESLGVKCFNWGTGYDGNYHSVKGFVYLEDTYKMVIHFLRFHAANAGVRLPHEKKVVKSYVHSTWPSHGSTRWLGGKREKYVSGKGWVADDIGSSRVGDNRVWNKDLKCFVCKDPKKTTVWIQGVEYPSYEAYLKGLDKKDKWDDDNEFELHGHRWRWNPESGHYEDLDDDKGVEVAGVRYDSYPDWWNATHGPDEQVDEKGDWAPPADVVDDIEGSNAMWAGTLWGHG